MSDQVRLCTIAAKNYLPSVVCLVESLREFHPEIPVHVLVIDGSPGYEARDLPFEVLFPDDLPLSRDTFNAMATYYDVTELSTAVKPTLMRLLLEDADVVMYLDPDIEVFAPLDDLVSTAREHSIVLTPHVTTPVPRDGRYVAEESFLVSGQFNLGFIALGRDATPFLDYWEERTRRLAVNDPASGYFTDQRWVDAVPSLFPHFVVRDPGCNVAYWNLHERSLTIDEDGCWRVNGTPMRFFHFSGHDDRQPYVLSKHLVGPPRVRVDVDPALRRLLRERSARMATARGGAIPPPYALNRTKHGFQLDRTARRGYWDALRAAEAAHEPLPPHAFDSTGGRSFTNWLNEPVSSRGAVSRYLFDTWRSRPELRVAFPDPLGSSAPALAHWASTDPDQLAATPSAVRTLRTGDAQPGVNLVGYLAGEFGVGAASRLMSRLVRGAGLPLATSALFPDGHRHTATPVTTLEGAPFDLSLLMLNADALLHLWHGPELDAHRERRRVAVWYWEVGILPEWMAAASSLVDEIWCASDYVCAALEPWSQCPVVKHPMVLAPTIPTALRRDDLDLPEDRFIFGFSFDYASVCKRKNPTGLIDAYCAAFGPDDGAMLALKTINSDRYPAEAAMVRDAARERSDIVFIDRFLDPLVMRAFFQLIDCYVSLHRAEGLGLTIAAAMATGTPAIATGWSGNLEFMTEHNSVLVGHEFVEVGEHADPYPPRAIWAEPDPHDAASSMRRLFDAPEEARALGRRAAADLAACQQHGAGREWLVDRYVKATGTRVGS